MRRAFQLVSGAVIAVVIVVIYLMVLTRGSILP